MVSMGVLVGLLCFLPVFLLRPLLEPFERHTLDSRFLYMSDAADASDEIIIVTIDQKTLDFFKEKKRVYYPFPRDFYALALQFLGRTQTEAIGIDMLFSEPDLDRLESDGAETDGAFAEAMRKLGNVYLVALLWRGADGTPPTAEQNRLLDSSTLSAGDYITLRGNAATLPIPTLLRASKSAVFANVTQDDDGVVRSMPLQVELTQRPFGTLGYKMAYDKGLIADTPLPTDADGRLPLRFYGPGGTGPKACYRSISFFALVQSEINMRQGKEPLITPATFKGKYVFFGATAPGLLDFRSTPFSSLEPYPGVELHATQLNNLMAGEFLTLLPPWAPIVMALLWSLLIAMTFFLSDSYRVVAGVSALALIGHQCIAIGLFGAYRIWFPVVLPSATLILSLVVSALVKYTIVGRSRRALRSAFSRYVSPDLVEQLARSESAPCLGGEELRATVFFSDIAGFTTISESMTPPEVVSLLNEYHSAMSNIVHKHGGMVDKFIGDGLMAIFHAPTFHPEHALHACLAALECFEKLDEIAPGLKEKYGQTIRARIGLDTGDIVVGNIGSATRLEYTAIGDTVNAAARLEVANKLYGTRILVGEDTVDDVKDRLVFRKVDRMLIKGKTRPKRIYEVVALPGNVTPEELKMHEDFQKARELYLAQKFDDAEQLFASHPSDPVSVAYAERSRELKNAELAPDWNGVFEQTSK
jgi:adenylate cyclase